MTWDLDDEHRSFQTVCRAFVDDVVQPFVRNPAGAPSAFPCNLWHELGAAGLLGLSIPSEWGGVDGDALSVAVLAEELARADSGLAITPLVSSYMAAPHIVRYGSAEHRDRFLPLLASGELIAAIAVTEPDAGSDVAGIKTRASPSDSGWSLHGAKTFITNAGLADIMVVAAKTDATAAHRGITTFLIDAHAPGVSVGQPLLKLGWRASDTRPVFLDAVPVSQHDVLGEAGRGFYQIMECFQLERVVLSGMAVGLAQACLDELNSWVEKRPVFGTTLSGLQVIRHRLAAIAVDVETARLITYAAAARLDHGHADAGRYVAMAKYHAARVANRVADEAVQFFGGTGFMDETPVTRHFRDARILRIGGGTDEIQLEIIAKRLISAPS